MKPRPHQIKYSKLVYEMLKEKGYCYLQGEVRSGKTLVSILAMEVSLKINSVLVLCPKQAIAGWEKFITPNLLNNYHITNYEQAHKLNADDYDVVIIDESHNLGHVGKPNQRYKTIRKLCWDKPHLHLSGTAIVETANSIYYQMTISKFSPFRHRSFYDFFREFGKPYSLTFYGKTVAQYDRFKDDLLIKINEFTIYMSQEDAGITVKAEDKLHYVELDESTKEMYNTLQKEDYLDLEKFEIVADSVMKLRVSLHMIEQGVAKVDDEYYELGNTEKIDYIKKEFGDTEDVGIMSHFVAERKMLAKHFKKANIYSSTTHAEGVDLSHLKHFIIISSDYRGSKFIQRRERIVNINGSNTLTVHHILVKGAISDQVYKKVSKKQDFNNKTYRNKSLV